MQYWGRSPRSLQELEEIGLGFSFACLARVSCISWYLGLLHFKKFISDSECIIETCPKDVMMIPSSCKTEILNLS